MPVTRIKPECVWLRAERESSKALQPDVISSWTDWEKVQPFIFSGWMIPGKVPMGVAAPASK